MSMSKKQMVHIEFKMKLRQNMGSSLPNLSFKSTEAKKKQNLKNL